MSSFVCGLDLGQANDYSALCILERREMTGYTPDEVRVIDVEVVTREAWVAQGRLLEPERTERHTVRKLWRDGQYHDLPEAGEPGYDLRFLKRWQRGTPYPTIVAETCDLMRLPPLGNQAMLVIDGTGVGRAVVDMFRQAAGCPLLPVLITAGNTVSRDDAGYTHIPKRDLVGVVQVLLQNRRVRFAAGLPEVSTLQAELQNFQVKITAAANDTYGAWREGQHDDLVLCLALALWQANRRPAIQAGWL